MSANRGRPKIGPTIQLPIPQDHHDMLTHLATNEGVHYKDLVRRAIAFYLADFESEYHQRKGYERLLLERLVTANMLFWQHDADLLADESGDPGDRADAISNAINGYGLAYSVIVWFDEEADDPWGTFTLSATKNAVISGRHELATARIPLKDVDQTTLTQVVWGPDPVGEAEAKP